MTVSMCSYGEISVGDLNALVATIAGDNDFKRYFLPKYQRPASWSHTLRVGLIQSLRKGFPVGALLLAKRKEKDGSANDTWQIIDGQQRTLSIINYYANKSAFLKPTDISETHYDGLRRLAEEACGIEIGSDEFQRNLYKSLADSDLDNPQTIAFWNSVFQEVGIDDAKKLALLQDSDLQGRTAQLLKSITDDLDISDVKIPLIKYEGPEEHLPAIFEALNMGVPLEKYEILAATWQMVCHTSEPEVSLGIKRYWESRAKDGEIVIDGLDDDGLPTASTLFDVLSGAGYLACEQNKLILKPGWHDSLAFTVATICHELRLSELGRLQSVMAVRSTTVDGELAVDPFVLAFLSSCRELESILKSRLGLKLNRESSAQFPGHTAYQISSMIAFLMLEQYEPSTWQRRSPRIDTAVFSQALLSWFLFDMLEDDWGNAGDSKLFNRVWLSREAVAGVSLLELRHEYSAAPNRESFAPVFSNWINRQIAREDTKRYPADPVTKVVLKYFYSTRVSFAANHEETFHLDHLIPVTWWDKLFEYFSDVREGAPINCIGNLCLMSKRHNSNKHGNLPKTWYDIYVPTSPETKTSFQKLCSDDYFLIDEDNPDLPHLADFDFPEEPVAFSSHPMDDRQYVEKMRSKFKALCLSRCNVISSELLATLTS